jgi:hypothetical protein
MSYQPATYRTTNTLAVVSLVCGIAAWTVLPVIAAVAAIICGHMARGEIRRAQGAMDGDAMAVIGLVSGYIQLALFALFLVFFVAILLLGFGIASQFLPWHWS